MVKYVNLAGTVIRICADDGWMPEDFGALKPFVTEPQAYDRVKENIRTLRQYGVDVNVKASSYMYPPVRINGEQFGCGNRLSAAEAAECAVQWDALRFTNEEFELRAQNMAKLINEDQDGCPVEVGEGIRCRAGHTSFWMTWDGRMMPCGMMTTPVAYPLEVGFEKAWEQIRTATAEIRTPGKCVGCDYKDLCGACAAVCYTETGNFEAVPTYMCERAKEIVRMTQKVYTERNSHDH